MMKMKNDLTLLALGMGMMIPFLYFGIQVIAAPFYPGYSFLMRDASTLGSPGSSFPSLFNIGSIITGFATIIAAWGFLRAFREVGVRPILAWVITLALISSGVASINAGIFPLPNPRHTEGLLALIGTGMLLLPLLLPIALWKLPKTRMMKVYFIVNLIAIIALIPVISGLIQRWSVMTGVDLPQYQNFLNNYQGLLQRIAALIVYVPIGVSAYYLAQASKRQA